MTSASENFQPIGYFTHSLLTQLGIFIFIWVTEILRNLLLGILIFNWLFRYKCLKMYLNFKLESMDISQTLDPPYWEIVLSLLNLQSMGL